MASEKRLIWTIAITQLVGWGCLFTPFQLMIAPMERELGWSRTEISGAFTLGLLVSGLMAIPAGRWVDRHGGRGAIAWGGLAGALVLAAWGQVQHLWMFYALWVLLGMVQAAALWGSAMAVMVSAIREPMRAITAVTFITGFTGTLFLPMIALLNEALGWRGALLVLALLQATQTPVALWGLRGTGPKTRETLAPVALGPILRRPAFLGLALCLSAHSFIGVGLGAHLVLLLKEKGIAEAWVITLVALHGPFQVAARGALYAMGARVRMVAVGVFACALLPLGLAWLWWAPPVPLWLLGFVLCWAIADGLLTIVRAGAPAELLGKQGYGAITGALTASAVLPRAMAPAVIALIWQSSGSYAPVPPLLVLVGMVAFCAFIWAARDRR
ncbi:MAG: MFS transporter [Alphaproteobacteria bacterium]|nr:MFS transporter [Alphaproteobacteria bacterium]